MPQPSSTAARPYHHGGLREALIAAAEQLMAEQAAWTFTLREVARVAGVSHNAPYNHFADRRALLAAVATRGFDELDAALRSAINDVPSEQVEARIEAAACAYVAFSVAGAARFRLMFSAELSGCEDAELTRAGERAFGRLRTLVDSGRASGAFRDDPDGSHALAAWSLVHGLSTLILDRKVAVPPGSRAVVKLAGAVSSSLIRGLAQPL